MNSLKEKVDNLNTEKPKEKEAEDTPQQESSALLNETVDKLSKLESRTKGGFGKVKEDFKKLNESLD